MPTDWLGGNNPSVLLTCLLTVGVSTAVMYISAELGGRTSRLAADADASSAASERNSQKSPHEQAA